MIHRQNWTDVNAHLEYRAEVRGDARGTQQTRESHLRLLLLWADDQPFPRASHIRPAFPAYLDA